MLMYSETERILQEEDNPFPWYLVVAGFSLVGCSSNILLATGLKKWREATGKMVISLAIFHLLIALSWFLPTEIAQVSYIGYLFGWGASLPMTACFAYGLLLTVRHNHTTPARMNQLFWRFLAISVASGIVFSIQGMVNVYTTTANIINLCFRSVMVIGAIALCLKAYLVVLRLREQYELSTSYEPVFLMFPLVMVLTIIPWILCLLCTMLILHQDFFPTAIGTVMSGLTASPGFLNGLIYICTRDVRETMARTCKRRKNDGDFEQSDLTESMIDHENNAAGHTNGKKISLPEFVSKEEDN